MNDNTSGEVKICIDCQKEFSCVQEYSHFTGKKLPTIDRCPACDDIFLMQDYPGGPCIYIMKKYNGYYVGSCLSLRKRYSNYELQFLVKTFACDAWKRRILEQEVLEYLTLLDVPLMNKRRAFLEFHAFLRGHSWQRLPENVRQFCKTLAYNTKQRGKE